VSSRLAIATKRRKNPFKWSLIAPIRSTIRINPFALFVHVDCAAMQLCFIYINHYTLSIDFISRLCSALG
jgi:hypothetical protein